MDCVVASVPNKFHPSTVIPALDHGKHVWCEKPLARNPEEGLRMVKAAIQWLDFSRSAPTSGTSRTS